jgi:hypothetical protein
MCLQKLGDHEAERQRLAELQSLLAQS